MKKLYTTRITNDLKSSCFSFSNVLFFTKMVVLLSSVSPAFASNLAITGTAELSSDRERVGWRSVSHGSIMLAGDNNDFCGADSVIGRANGTNSVPASRRITAEEEYSRFLTSPKFDSYSPYGETTGQQVWSGNGRTRPNGYKADSSGYMGVLTTGGNVNILPSAFGVYSFATGCGSYASGNYSTAFGASATALTGGSMAFGIASLAEGKVSIAMGISSEASGESSVALGGLATSKGNHAVAIGTRAHAEGAHSIAIGGGEEDADLATSKGQRSIAIGHHATSEGDASIALGGNATVRVSGGVAIGSGSVSKVAAGVSGYHPMQKTSLNRDTDTEVWKSTAGAFSVGNADNKVTRQIVGVAAGSADTDAVNVAQLKEIQKLFAEDEWSFTVNEGKSTDIGSNETMDFSNAGKSLKIAKNDAGDMISFDLAENISVKNIDLEDVSLSDAGLIIANGPKITPDGIDAANKKITSVLAGVKDTDAVNVLQLNNLKEQIANSSLIQKSGETGNITIGTQTDGDKIDVRNVNKDKRTITGVKDADLSAGSSDAITGSQLYTVQQELRDASKKIKEMGTNVAQYFGGSAGYSDETWNAPSFKVQVINDSGVSEEKTYTNVGEALTGVDNSFTNMENIIITQMTNLINQDIGDVKGHNLVKKDEETNFITIGKDLEGYTISIADKDNGQRILSGVKDAVNDHDAINKSQLDSNIKIVKDDLNEKSGQLAQSITDITKEAKSDVLSWSKTDNAFVADHGDDNSKTMSKITHLAQGSITSGSTDAITGGQIYSLTQQVAQYFGGGAGYNDGTWNAPSFKVKTIKNGGDSEEKTYDNIASALTEVGNSFTNMENNITTKITNELSEKIDDVKGSNLVQITKETNLITIGKEVEGDTIDIANKDNEQRILSGVKDAVNDDDAINKSQLDANIKTVENNLNEKSEQLAQSITDIAKEAKGDVLSWSKTDNAFVADHGDDNSKTKSKVTHLANGLISSDSTDAITGGQIYSLTQQVAQYFGGGAGYNDGTWNAPNFKVQVINDSGVSEEKTYTNVGEALTGVGNSFTNMENNLTTKITNLINQEIGDVTGNSLVKKDEETNFITIGKDLEGYTISIADKDNGQRILSGVKDAVNDHDAINKSQLDSNIKIVKDDLNKKSGQLAQSITDITKEAKSDVLSWSKTDNAFVADHGDDNSKTMSKITHLAQGSIASGSTDAITGGQIYSLTQQVAQYFGGGAGYNDGIWNAPSFKVKTIKNGGDSEEKTYDNIASALTEVGNSFTNMENNITTKITNELSEKIGDVKGNNLVQITKKTNLITIGKEVEGDTIDIANKDNEQRILSGVKDAVNDDDAINKSQLDANIKTVENNLNEKSEQLAQSITDIAKEAKGDVLSWSKTDNAFVADHGDDNSKTKSKVTHLANGLISSDSTDAITGGQIYSLTQQVAQYFGGGAGYNDGTWNAPNFKVQVINDSGVSEEKTYTNVGEALTGVGNSFTNMENNLTTKITNLINQEIGDVTGNSLVKKDEETNFITIGKDLEGYTISIADKDNGQRILSGVKDAVNDHDAINKSQLDSNIKIVKDDLNKKSGQLAQSITDITKEAKSDVLSWSKTDNAFVADHGDDNSKTMSKITHLAQGSIASGSTDAITGGQIYSLTQQVAQYFGGGAGYNDGIWNAPSFKVKTIKNGGDSEEKTYDNIASALTEVGNSFTNMENNITTKITNELSEKIGDVKGNNLVQITKKTNLITIGKEVEGDTIDIANKDNEQRILSGVKDAVNDDDAINKSQLDANIKTVENNLNEKSEQLAQSITDIAKEAKGDVLSWSKTDNAFVADHGDDNSKTKSKVTHLANGLISSDSTDAITGGQIYSLTQQVAQYFGGGASYNGTTWQAPTFKVKTFDNKGTESEQEYHNVASAFEGINSTFAYINKEFKSEINNVTGEFIVKQDADTNVIAVGKEKSGLKVTFANVDGISRILSGVKGGELSETSTEAINGSQLYSMGTQFAAFLGGGAGYSNGKWNAPSFSVVQFNSNQLADNIKYNNVNNVSDAFDAVNESMLSINDRIHDVEQNTVSNGIYWDANDGAYSASHNEKDGKITHVADGKIALGSTDAVNGGQLFAINSQVTKIENKVDSLGSQVQSIAQVVDNVIAYDKDENGKLSITLGEGDDSAPVLISNVADGEIKHGSTDAVNGGQVYDFTKEQMALVLEDAKKRIDEASDAIVLDKVLSNVQNYADIKFDLLNKSIEDVKKESRQAAAIGLAVSNLRYYDDPGALSVSVAGGLWRGEAAFAMGVGYTSEAGDMRSNLSVTSAGGHWGIGAGITLKLK
ncbi:YadA-like family protein [Bartonella sp. B30(2025)]